MLSVLLGGPFDVIMTSFIDFMTANVRDYGFANVFMLIHNALERPNLANRILVLPVLQK